MKTSSQYRAEARAALSGKWATSALFYFSYAVVTAFVSILCSLIPIVGSVVSMVVVLPFGYSLTVAFLRQFRGEEQQLGWLFENFNARVWLTTLLVFIYTFLWTLLLIVPGIIKGYSYAMTPYILRDEPSLENNAAIEKSMAMMDGHKWDLFVLDLTFIGWYLLSIFTLGIACFWIAPYQSTAHAAFYESLKQHS